MNSGYLRVIVDTVLPGLAIDAPEPPGDDEIDDTRRRVEKACIELIWKQQPVAGELRAIAGMLQIVTDLERIGDYAVDIAKNAIKLADVAVRPASVEVGRIANLAYEMLQDVMRAYREGDAALADDVIERDDEVPLRRLGHFRD